MKTERAPVHLSCLVVNVLQKMSLLYQELHLATNSVLMHSFCTHARNQHLCKKDANRTYIYDGVMCFFLSVFSFEYSYKSRHSPSAGKMPWLTIRNRLHSFYPLIWRFCLHILFQVDSPLSVDLFLQWVLFFAQSNIGCGNL